MKKITPKRAAEMWCELNCWQTPDEMMMSKPTDRRRKAKAVPLRRDEIGGAMRAVEAFTTPELIDYAWQNDGPGTWKDAVRAKREAREKPAPTRSQIASKAAKARWKAQQDTSDGR